MNLFLWSVKAKLVLTYVMNSVGCYLVLTTALNFRMTGLFLITYSVCKLKTKKGLAFFHNDNKKRKEETNLKFPQEIA